MGKFEKIQRAEIFLNKYFEHFKFKIDIIQKYILLIDKYSLSEFYKLVKSENRNVMSGKQTIIFWTQKGYSNDESIELSNKYKIHKNPSDSPMNINFWKKKGFSDEDAISKIKSQRKMNIEYWTSRGYSIELSEIKRREYQIENSNKFAKKRIDNPEKYNNINSNQIKYWLDKGFSKEDSIKNVSMRQLTFSKEICIEKYGDIEGIKIWKERQNKWLKSLESSDYNMSDGKSVSMDYKIENFNIDELVNSITIKHKELFKHLLEKCKTIDEFIENYSMSFNKDDEITLYKILRPIHNSILLHKYYNTNNKYILSLIIPKIVRIKNKYSYISWFNGHICRSDCEYILANFLFKNDINYVYEKRYENSKMRCDFYLIKYNLYIEYLGMKIESYKTKLEFINTNNINCIYSSNINELKFLILQYVNTENK